MTADWQAEFRCSEGHTTTRSGLGRPPEVTACRALVGNRTECSREARLVTSERSATAGR